MTGGGSGIGAATVRRLAAEGAAVAVLDVRTKAAEEVAAAVRAAGGSADAITCDVADPASVADAVEVAAATLGGLDAVVPAAGIARAGITHELSLEEWELTLRVNLTGVFLTLRAAIPHLLAAGGGSIVTVGSVASLVAAGQAASYDASKGGVLQLTRAVAAEYADRSIRASCVCPGVVRTGLGANTKALHGRSPGPSIGIADRMPIPMDRAADPDELAGVIAFLVSDDASFVTGAAIAADGGYTAI